ncbi:MAG: radical SAM protein [Candidatus Omnitrophica bacterium]|nr:radical SAM protein [Candidatus Omnitrophota bacterium]
MLNSIYSVNCEVTTRCNLLCEMCSRTTWVKDGNFKSEDIMPEVLDKVLKEIRDLFKSGKKIVFMTNGLGDPLLYHGLIDLVARVKEISDEIKFSFTTNAVALSEKRAYDLIQAGVDEITVSINAADRESYRELMGADLYEKVTENMQNFLKIRKELKSNIPVLHIQFIKTIKTNPSLAKGISFWKGKIGGQDKVFVHEPVTHAGIIDVSALKCEGSWPNLYPCAQCWSRMAVRINGDVYPCDAAYYSNEPIKDLLLGNVLNQTLFGIYFSNNSKILNIRKMQKESNYSKLPSCSKCDTFKLVPNVFFKIPYIYGKQMWK